MCSQGYNKGQYSDSQAASGKQADGPWLPHKSDFLIGRGKPPLHALQEGFCPVRTLSVSFCHNNLTLSVWSVCMGLNNQPPLDLSNFQSAKKPNRYKIHTISDENGQGSKELQRDLLLREN